MNVLVVNSEGLPFGEPPISALGEVRRRTESEVAANGAETIGEDLVVLLRSTWDEGAAPILRSLRRHGAPLLIVLGRSDAAMRVDALQCGADDVLDVPFAPAEFLARARALVRRSLRMRCGPIDVDVFHRVAALDGKPLTLSPREFEVLLVLVRQAGDVVTSAELAPRAGGERRGRRGAPRAAGRKQSFAAIPNWLQVYVHGLRRKLGVHASLLRTVPGVGYRLDERVRRVDPSESEHGLRDQRLGRQSSVVKRRKSAVTPIARQCRD